jgi:hypothetical protein
MWGAKGCVNPKLIHQKSVCVHAPGKWTQGGFNIENRN